MKNFSNTYIYIYASALVVVIALVLSICATRLQPFQIENKNQEKMQGILKTSHSDKIMTDNITSNYQKYITKELTIDKNGIITDEYQNGKCIKGDSNNRAFKLNVKAEMSCLTEGKNGKLGIFVYQDEHCTKYIIPIYGKGLWGPIWGNIAIAEDGSTIVGAYFNHQGETPGLGAEIANEEFQNQFIGKTLFEQGGSWKGIVISKMPATAMPEAAHEVDAISGGTITSKGVETMINSCLNYYQPFLKTLQNGN